MLNIVFNVITCCFAADGKSWESWKGANEGGIEEGYKLQQSNYSVLVLFHFVHILITFIVIDKFADDFSWAKCSWYSHLHVCYDYLQQKRTESAFRALLRQTEPPIDEKSRWEEVSSLKVID